MKLTQSKIDWIKRRVAHYCKLLEIDTPLLILTKSRFGEFKKWLRNQTGRGKIKGSNSLGCCFRKRKVIFLQVKWLPDVKSLDETIRHELIHYAKRYHHSTREFYDRMNRLQKGKVKNGRFC